LLVAYSSIALTKQTEVQACTSVCFVSAIEEYATNKKLLKVTDLLGRETKGTKNEILFYIYDDGKVEKKLIIE